jgi:hypothetical protein
LDLLKYDLINDTSSEGHPLCSVNYVWLTAQFTLLFSRIENALKSLRNPVWVRAYEEDPLLTLETRASLTMLALAMENDGCLRVFQPHSISLEGKKRQLILKEIQKLRLVQYILAIHPVRLHES